ncbi:MAG TPA: cytochrome c biogenesis protein CcsA [Candidatus Sulfopaludibacter sp.]|nr:cytochrome c biogenesis protein CcsA [Candidatus Sulfopaludibacter sp.]
MNKIIPWVVAAVFAAWVLSTLHEPPEPGFHTRDFGRLPALLNGRVQPLDSVARSTLLQIRERQSVGDLGATAWLMETMMNPDAADKLNVFRIDNFELLNMLQLPEAQKYYSFSQIQPHLDDLTREAQRANDVEDANRTAFQRQLLKLDNALDIYQRLKLSLCPPGTTDFAGQLAAYEQAIPAGVAAAQAQEAKKTFDQAALNRLLDFLSSYNDLAKYAYPLMVPPPTDAKSRADWQNVGQNLMSVVHGNDFSPAVKDYAAMVTAYNQNQPAAFNQALDDYRQWLGQWFAPEARHGIQEFFFNDFAPFYKAMIIYVTAFLLAVIALLTFALMPKTSEVLRQSAFWLVVLGGIIHTFGLVFRMWLEGRPPVTNLYSSAIFIGWGCVILGIILERVFAVGLGSAVASFAGFVTLIIAHNLSMDGDTMEMLRAVLDTNFWLATHVVVVTLGYASTFMAGLLGVTYVLLGLFTPLLKYKSGNLELGKVLAKMTYGIVCFAALFSFTGTVLGGIWADQSWGRFWGWDPKENGALIIVLWNAAILHARWGGMIRERGLMNMVIFGNIVTSWSWFGVNMLGIGLHSYGFMAAAFWWLLAFVLSQISLIGLGMLPTGMWRSFRSSAQSGTSDPSVSKTAPKTHPA